MPGQLVGIKPQDQRAPNTDEHGVAIEFPDDHRIDGIKIRILGLTPEQITIAAWWLQRTADQAKDAEVIRKLQQQQVAEMDVEDVRRTLARKS